MSRSGVLLLFVVVGVMAVSATTATQDEFTRWVSRHKKSYGTAEEYRRRFETFQRNAHHVARHNAAAAKGHHSHTLGMSGAFADLTNAEYRALVLRAKTTPSLRHGSAMIVMNTTRALPTSWDWRSQGAVNPIKDEGASGYSWSFAATAALETAWFLKSGALLTFSEQMCADCAANGHDASDCYKQVVQQGGEELSSDYPNTGGVPQACRFDPSKAVGKFTGSVKLSPYDEGALASAVTHSVVSARIDASSIDFQLYEGGIYNEANCKWRYEELDHSVAVVGYGVANSTKYWLVRNSWGEEWGVSGYILMSKDANNQCGIATAAAMPTTA